MNDKQLGNIKLKDVLKKRELDQALNIKEFSVLAGISYSLARSWFRMPGFPVIRGVVFWRDFAKWRNVQTGLNRLTLTSDQRQAARGLFLRSRKGFICPSRDYAKKRASTPVPTCCKRCWRDRPSGGLTDAPRTNCPVYYRFGQQPGKEQNYRISNIYFIHKLL